MSKQNQRGLTVVAGGLVQPKYPHRARFVLSYRAPFPDGHTSRSQRGTRRAIPEPGVAMVPLNRPKKDLSSPVGDRGDRGDLRFVGPSTGLPSRSKLPRPEPEAVGDELSAPFPRIGFGLEIVAEPSRRGSDEEVLSGFSLGDEASVMLFTAENTLLYLSISSLNLAMVL